MNPRLIPQAAPEDLLPWTAADELGGVAARFERVAHACPEATAIKSGERVVRYGELNEAANRIAHALLGRLGEANVPVASLLGDRVTVIQALLGVLKAGKIHAPLAPELPAARLQLVLDNVGGAPLVLVDAAHRALAARLGLSPERQLDLDAPAPDLPAGDPCLSISPESFAYILYTSGSTGRPKGVAHKHRVVVSRVQRWQITWGLGPGVRILQMSSPGHTSAVAVMMTSLLTGATLCPFSLEEDGLANLRDFLLRERVMRWVGTASIFRHFMATLGPADRFPNTTYVTFHGEAVLRKDFELFQQHFPPDAVLRTGLGSTEAGVIGELFLHPQSVVTERILPAGIPETADSQVYILDDEGKGVGQGVVGEIAVRSRNLAEYWRSPELNARAFIPDPEQPGERIFRSGDLGLLRADGMLEHHGRTDLQVKVRGNRVELGEIEMALLELGNIREAVVVAQSDAAGETHLIAYVVPELQPAPSPGWLRERLAERLPGYMAPAAFVVLDALPLTSSGKIDRARLPAPALLRVEGGAARDALEEQLARIWAELLHVPHVGRDENFFDLGGNSLVVMRLFSQIEETLGRKLPLSIMFQAGTVSSLAALIRVADAAAPSETCLVPIQTKGARRPFFLAAGGAGDDVTLLVYAPLARYLGPEQPFYGLRARFVPAQRGANGAVEAIAAGHVAEIRAVQPQGPYLLGGECIGGIVAVEMARQLRAQGETVSLLCLLDTVRSTLRTRLMRRLETMVGGARQAVQNSARIPSLPAPPPQTLSHQNYVNATTRYRPRRSAERITLLVNQEQYGSDPALGWQPLAGGGVEIHALPGTRVTYIREHPQAVGECLRGCLERAQEPGQ